MKRILVVVDMQNDFTTGPLGNAEVCSSHSEGRGSDKNRRV